jgi:uncharacterized protein YbjT (DUF2867 family)
VKVLLTGATGFVGGHLYPALAAAGHEVICATRDPDGARGQHPDRRWVELDVERGDALEEALAGCDAAYYLVHSMAAGGDYPEREIAGAERFTAAAAAAGVRRLVYLGGVLPAGEASRHLSSRRRTGEILRGGAVSAVELRAAMIIGAGSASWTMVLDLAARLPAMLLPRWLRNHSHPIAIDDVIYGLLAALTWPGDESWVFELPGPERITHRDLLRRVAGVLGHQRLMIDVPVLSPRLSSYWIALITRVDLGLARELVEGVRHDLDPGSEILWDRVDHRPMSIEAAVRLALDDAEHEAAAAARARQLGIAFGSGAA